MSALERIDAFQQRHRVVGFALAVIYKYFDDQGNYLAAVMAYYGLVAILPLLLLLSTILGLVLSGHPHLQHELLHSAVSQFPAIGQDLASPKRHGSPGLVIGVLGSVYGGLGVAQAAQNAMNVAWAVPRNDRPNPFKARGISVLLLGTVGLAVLGTTVLSALGVAGTGTYATSVAIALTIAAVVINTGIFMLAFRLATARELTIRQIAPGAFVAAVLWQILQTVGAVYIRHVVNGATATNGVFAVVLGLVGFIFLASISILMCVEINVVRVRRLHPRALLTPFTDDADLTQGDRNSYTAQAQATRSKGFQQIDVTYDEPERQDVDP